MASTALALPDGYGQVLDQLKRAVASANLRARRAVNTEMLSLYWTIGNTISQQEETQGWGARVVDRLAQDLRAAYPTVKGLSPRNLRYMRSFATAWPAKDEMLQRSVATLGWGAINTLLDGLNDTPTRDWYADRAVAGGWTRAILLNQIKGQLHARIGAAPSNLPTTLGEDSELARELAKDPVILDFLDITGQVSEQQLEDALIHRLERFMLALGRGFSFVGRQVSLEVGDKDFLVDLLFFHIPTLRYIVIELKIDQFRPGHLGQLDFYVNVIDAQLRNAEKHAATVGILLVPDKDDVVVEYALRGKTTPLVVSQYEFDDLPAEERAALPSAEDLSAALRTPAPDEATQLRFSDVNPQSRDPHL